MCKSNEMYSRDGLGISLGGIQYDPAKIDWANVEKDAVRRLRVLRIAWEETFRGNGGEFHERMVRCAYVPALAYLAEFCEAVGKIARVEGDDSIKREDA